MYVIKVLTLSSMTIPHYLLKFTYRQIYVNQNNNKLNCLKTNKYRVKISKLLVGMLCF